MQVDGLFYLARAASPISNGHEEADRSFVRFWRGGNRRQFAHNATKGANKAMMQALALDLGPFGVRVNVVAPSFAATRLTQDRLDDPVGSG